MFRRIFQNLLITFMVVSIFSCGGGSNSKDSLLIDLEENPDVINVLEEEKGVSLHFSSEFSGKDVVVNLPNKKIEINTSTTQHIKVPKDINYVVITDSQGKTIAITVTFTENIDLTPENIALSIIFMNTPFLRVERLTSESIASIRSDLITLSSFNELVIQIRNQLLSASYIDLSSLEPYIKSAVNDFISILVTDKNIGYSSISISPSNEYHRDLMLEIQEGSFVATNMYDKYGNKVYKGKVDVYNKGLLWQELLIVDPGVAVSTVGGFVAPMMVSDFAGTFTSIEGLKRYFSDIINLNITNSTWDAKKTTLELLVSCNYNTICSYIGVNVLGKDRFNEFINYIVNKPDLVNQLYNYLKNEDYSIAISLIKEEFIKWARGKISDFLISSITNHLNFLERNLKVLDVLQSQITKFLSLISISKDPRYCWKFENIDCNKTDNSDNYYPIKDYSDITKGRIISIPSNKKIKIRIVPDINWIEGGYDGIVCSIDANGEWGSNCILYANEEDFINSDQCQIIVFEDQNDSWRFEKEEEKGVLYATNIACSQLLGKYITININNLEYQLGDYSYLTNGTVAISNFQINDSTKVRIVPSTHWDTDWDGIICDIDENNRWGYLCRLEINEDEFQSNNCQLIIFTDSNNDWELNSNENHLFYLETNCSNIKNMYLDGTEGIRLDG